MNADQGEWEHDYTVFRRHQRRELRRLICWYFPQAEWERAIWVAWKVSDMTPGATNRTGWGGYGLFQLDPAAVGIPEEQAWRLYNPITNVAAAYGLWQRQGWRPWNIELWPSTIREEFDREE